MLSKPIPYKRLDPQAPLVFINIVRWRLPSISANELGLYLQKQYCYPLPDRERSLGPLVMIHRTYTYHNILNIIQILAKNKNYLVCY